MATGDAAEHLLSAVDRIRPLIMENAANAETNGQLSGTVYAAMYQAGLFAMFAPKARGGFELHPIECMRVLEAVARIDSAAAWNLVMNQAVPNFAAWLPAEGVDELFDGGVPTAASGFYPTAQATRADGGWRITGQVSFASGCHHAKWLAIPAVEMQDGHPKVDPTTGQPAIFVGFFPRSAASVKDTWNTVGMRGTGSADIAARDLFVPDKMIGFIGPLKRPAPGFEGPLYRMFPLHGLLGEAIVSVGVAAAAVDEAVRLCKAKVPAFNAVPLREQQLAQYQMGKAKARVEAARDTLYRAADAAYGDVAPGGTSLSIEAKIRVQLALSFAAETCAEAVRYVNDAIGASSIRLENPFERHFRDLHVLMQHSDKSSARYASAGRMMLGLENDWIWLSF